MRVVAVVPYHAGSESAQVTVSDGRHVCEAFCWPCSCEVGAEIAEPLQLFDTTVFMRSHEISPRLEYIGPQYQHRGVAQVLDKDLGLLQIGGLCFEESLPWPGGIEAGDLVEFECVRIDIPRPSDNKPPVR